METITLRPIKSAPIGQPILLYWEDWGHYEDGTIYDDGEDPERAVYHVLFDGDSMRFEPSHWAPLPKKEFID